MSKIGIQKIDIPPEVEIKLEQSEISVVGPKGELKLNVPKNIEIKRENQELTVVRLRHGKYTRSLHGLFRKLIANLIIGVTAGFERKLDFKGVGFRAEVSGDKLILNIGFSHPVEIPAGPGIGFKVEKNIITVLGIDKEKVGQVAANIRAVKPVEPYKGKGIKYLEEVPRRKPGKAAKAVIGSVAS